MIQAILAAGALSMLAPIPSSPGVIQACLYADLTQDEWPLGISALHRRFPSGGATRHIARLLTASENSPAGTRSPQVMLVHDLGQGGPGPLVQVSVSTAVAFDPQSPASVRFDIVVDGALKAQTGWPEYAKAFASFRRTGAPPFVATETWPVWGEAGAPLRLGLSPEAKRLEVRLVGDEGRLLQSSIFDLTAQPLPNGQLGAAVNAYASSDQDWCFNE